MTVSFFKVSEQMQNLTRRELVCTLHGKCSSSHGFHQFFCESSLQIQKQCQKYLGLGVAVLGHHWPVALYLSGSCW